MTTLFTGESDGADMVWTDLAMEQGMDIRVIRPSSMNKSEYESAWVMVLHANKTLQRHLDNLNSYQRSCIARNYYQIQEATSVYAVGFLDAEDRIQGGTAWACQMFLDKIPNTAFAESVSTHLYFLDQNMGNWFECKTSGNGIREFVWLDLMEASPPPPSGKWAGIGTRDLWDESHTAMWLLMSGGHCSKPK